MNLISQPRVGVRAHDLGCAPVEELARRVAANGFSCVQLALNKAILGLNMPAGGLHAELAREIGAAFARQGVGIEVLGCYINPIHPDPQTRVWQLEFFKDHLRVARDFGCRIVALESGSVNADYSPHPANEGEEAFAILLASLSELVAEAEKFDIMVGLEPVVGHTVSSTRKMRRVLDAIRSRHLGVVLDPVNLLSVANFRAQAEVMAEALEGLGDHVVVVHAKDFIFDGWTLRIVPAGHGQLDYGSVLNFVRWRQPSAALLLEGAAENTASRCAQFLMEKIMEL